MVADRPFPTSEKCSIAGLLTKATPVWVAARRAVEPEARDRCVGGATTHSGSQDGSRSRRARQRNPWQTCQQLSLLDQAAARIRALLSADTDQALVRARTSGEVLVGAMRLGLVFAIVVTNTLYEPSVLSTPLGVRPDSRRPALRRGDAVHRLPRRAPVGVVDELRSRRVADQRHPRALHRCRAAPRGGEQPIPLRELRVRGDQLDAPLRLEAVRLHGVARGCRVRRAHGVRRNSLGSRASHQSSVRPIRRSFSRLPDHRAGRRGPARSPQLNGHGISA